MPWKIVAKDGKFCVHKENSDKSVGELLKCYDSKEKATNYLRALYANVKNSVSEFSMFISKSSIQEDGIMHWSAVNSDTKADLYGERMTIELYRSMLNKIRTKEPPPAAFREMVCSDFWCGGMPYLSIAHYPDLNGKAVPGEPTELFIDGSQLKARGILFPNRLGKAVWKSLKEDENIPKDEERIRISIAFLDLAHKHGENGTVFTRTSLTDMCPNCVQGAGDKIYLDGYLVHLALTRVPVNPRTIMESEDVMAKKSQIKTRKEDAVSIVGDSNLVEEIHQAALESKSDVLVEMSETEDAPVVEESKHKDTEDMTAEDIHNADMSDEPDEDVDDKGKKKKSLTVEDVVEIVKSLLPQPVHPDTVSEPEVVKSALDIALDELYNSVSVAKSMQGATLEQRLESINPALQSVGSIISADVREAMGQVAPVPATNDQGMVMEAITTLSSTIKDLAQEVALLKEKSTTPSPVQSRMPAPRSIPSQLVAQSQAQQPVVNPNSIANIVRRSVSRDLPLK